MGKNFASKAFLLAPLKLQRASYPRTVYNGSGAWIHAKFM